MENSIIYFIEIASDQLSSDKLWGFLELETTYNLFVGDVINFVNKPYSNKLVKDYKTYSFEIISRQFTADDDHENNGGVITLVVKPFFVN